MRLRRLDELREKHHQQQIQSQASGFVKPETIEKPIPTITYSPSSSFAWNEPDPDWSNFQKWQHYENELKRITNNYHQQKVAVYQAAVDEDIKFFDNVLNKLQKGSPAYDDVKAVKDEFDEKKKALLSRNIYDSNGDIDPKAVEKLEHDWVSLHKNMHEEMTKCCQKHPNNTVLQECNNELQERHKNVKAKINTLDVEFEKARSELSEKIKEHHTASNKEVDNYLNQTVHILTSRDTSELNEQQKEQLPGLIKEIKECRAKLASINDSEKYQQALTEITNKINAVTSGFPPSIKEEIKGLTESLSKTVISLDSVLDSEASLIEEHEFIGEQVVAEEDNLDEQRINEVRTIRNEQISNHSETLSAIEKQRKMKLEVNNIKNHNPPIEQEISIKVNKTELQKLFNVIQDVLSNIDNNSLSSAEMDIVEGFKTNTKLLHDSGYEVSPEKLSSILSTLSEGINDLGEKIDDPEDLLNGLDLIQEVVKSQLETQESVNLSMR